MEIRSIDKKDLPMLANLANDPNLCSIEDVCLEHSKLCIDDDGRIIAFIIVKPNSLIDFFGGEIEADESVDKKGKYYKDGSEFHLHRTVSEHFQNKQYELIHWYLEPCEYDENSTEYVIHEEMLRNTFLRTMCATRKSKPIGIIWMPYERGCNIPILTEFFNLNNKILVSVPYVD